MMTFLTATTPMPVSDILSNAGNVVTSAFGWVGTAVEAVTSNPLILTSAVLGLVGLGIGITRRLLKLHV